MANKVLRKKILLLAAGGTIASAGENGLRPELDVSDIVKLVPDASKLYALDLKDILQLDSSEIQHQEWTVMASFIDSVRNNYDGIVLTHGTDTMAYTASALTFMLKGINIPVVLTGSQLPPEAENSDAADNLKCAFMMAASGIGGVFIAFNGKVMLGCRAVKVHTTEFSAFESINFPYIAQVGSDGSLNLNRDLLAEKHEYSFSADMSADVLLVKLTPGTLPEIFDLALKCGYKGFIVEGFGTGGIHSIKNNLPEKFAELARMGIPVVLKGQCLYGKSDLEVYEVGRKALEAGVLRSFDMTTEAAFAKLKWLLSKKLKYSVLKKEFETNIAEELIDTLPKKV